MRYLKSSRVLKMEKKLNNIRNVPYSFWDFNQIKKHMIIVFGFREDDIGRQTFFPLTKILILEIWSEFSWF